MRVLQLLLLSITFMASMIFASSDPTLCTRLIVLDTTLEAVIRDKIRYINQVSNIQSLSALRTFSFDDDTSNVGSNVRHLIANILAATLTDDQAAFLSEHRWVMDR